MSPKLSVLIIENNSIISVRLIDLLNDIEQVDNILYASNFKEAYKLMINIKVDVVMLCVHISDTDILELVSICKYDQHCPLIILSDNPQELYKERYQYLGLNYWLDKANDFDLIPQLINQISNDLV